MQQATYRMMALVVLLLGLGLAGCSADPAQSAVGPTPTTAPDNPTPAGVLVSPTPTAQPTPDAKPEWASYTNDTYGFTFRYPVTWGLTELPAGREAAGGSAPVEIRLMRDDLWLVIQVKSEDEPYVLGPSGRSAGDLVERGTVVFLGQEADQQVLVYEGTDKAITVGAEAGSLIFYVQLEPAPNPDVDYAAVAVPAKAQEEMATILASATLVPGARSGVGDDTDTIEADSDLTVAAGTTRTRETDGMTMVYVPAGRFKMGSTDDDVAAYVALCEAYDSYDGICTEELFAPEQPAHAVALDAYWIDQTEVTVAQYRMCVDAGVCDATAPVMERQGPMDQQPDFPVTTVFWNQAAAYCHYVGGRLPTEAEWEYAARGPKGLRFPWGDDFEPANLNYCDAQCDEMWGDEATYGRSPADVSYDDGYAYMAPVGSYPEGASWCGALDMAGNVDEWTADWIGFYTVEEQDNPTGPEGQGERRVIRGGSWRDFPIAFHSAGRIAHFPESGSATTGFRCVVPAAPGGGQ